MSGIWTDRETDALRREIAAFTDNSPWNFIGKEEAILPELVGLRIFDPPLLAFGAADDPMFEKLMLPEAVGPQSLRPEEWLPGAKTVVSLFYPFTKEVRESNRKGIDAPSPQWLHGRIEGQRFIGEAARFLAERFRASGNEAVVPALDARFRRAKDADVESEGPWAGRRFTSNWSERHAAYVCGLGTFGLSKGLITERGMAGRFSSIIVTAEIPPTERKYTGLYDYCTRCGACVRKCPVGAITLESGKEHEPCSAYLDKTREANAPRYGCGKCQVGVPCETSNPSAPR